MSNHANDTLEQMQDTPLSHVTRDINAADLSFLSSGVHRHDRAFVLDLVSEARNSAQSTRLSSVFHMMRKLDTPWLESPIAPCLLGLVIACEITAIWLTLRPYSDLMSICTGLAMQLLPVIAFSWRRSLRNSRRCRKFAAMINSAIEELDACIDNIEFALLSLDETPGGKFSFRFQDGYIYFVIVQIRDSLRTRVRNSSRLLDKNSAKSLETGISLLQSPLRIQLSVLKNQKSGTCVELWALTETCKGLFYELYEARSKKRMVA